MKIDAFGLVEVRGLVAAIEAADAMLKAAQVRLIRQHQVNPGFITLIVEGDLGACRAAVDAGVAASARLGEVVSRLEIGRPDDDTETMVLSLIPIPGKAEERPDAPETPSEPPAASDGESAAPEKTPPEADPATDEETASAADEADEAEEARAVMFTFIAESPRGCNWTEIIRFFPEYADYRYLLEEMVEEGRLCKKGARYLRNARDEDR
jgi:ethanolamine utilization protein EutK